METIIELEIALLKSVVSAAKRPDFKTQARKRLRVLANELRSLRAKAPSR